MHDNLHNQNTLQSNNPKSQWQMSNVVRIGSYDWRILEINLVGETKLLCEDVIEICYDFSISYNEKYLSEEIFSEKEIAKLRIKKLTLPSKSDVDRAISLGAVSVERIWLMGELIYSSKKAPYPPPNDYTKYGYRPIIIIEV